MFGKLVARNKETKAMPKKVLIIGWHPTVVDYAKYPGFKEEKLDAALRADERKLND
jgi:hypothetical protein